MPRICTSTSAPFDFCQKCFPSKSAALALYASLGDGPNGRGNCFEYDAEHPPYEHEDYTCDICNQPLSEIDNDARTDDEPPDDPNYNPNAPQYLPNGQRLASIAERNHWKEPDC